MSSTPRAEFLPRALLAFLVTAVSASSGAAQTPPYQVRGWDFPGGGNTNRLWLATASGDFNGDGIDEIAVLKAAGKQLAILSSPADADYDIVSGFDVDLTHNQFIGMAAGDLDANGSDELIVLRNVPGNGQALGNILVYSFGTDWSSTLKAKRQYFGGEFPWVGVASADFDGDGRDDIVVAKNGAAQQFLYFDLASTGDSLVLRKEVSSSIGALDTLRGVAAGDLDGNRTNEVVAVRAGSGSNADFIVMKSPLAASPPAWETFNYAGGTSHYAWRGVAVGEFDRNKANGLEIVSHKNVHSFFIYQKYRAGLAPTVVAARDYSSDANFPWVSIAAGNTILNDGVDELISIRQHPGTAATRLTLAVYGDELTSYNQKLAALQGAKSFHWGSTWQGDPVLRNPSSGVDHDALNVPGLVAYLDANHIPSLTFSVADVWIDPTTDAYPAPGTEYNALLELLHLLKSSNSSIKVIANFATPAQVADKPFTAPNPGDSPRIGAAELGGGISDERMLFAQLPDGSPKTTDYVTWFRLLGIIARKYPNLVGIGFDDFSHQVGPSRTFNPRYLGKMVKALRAENEQLAFIPTVYYGLAGDALNGDPTRDFARNYTDGFVFYTRNEKYLTDGMITPPDTPNVHPKARVNHHGAVILPESDIAGGIDSMREEIADFHGWMKNPLKLLMLGIYVMADTSSTVAPSEFTVERQMIHAYDSAYLDGVVMYVCQDPATSFGKIVHNRFLAWDLGLSLYDSFDSAIAGRAPAGWSVSAASATTCTAEDVDGRRAIQFSDNNPSGSAVLQRSFSSKTGTFQVEFSFRQTSLGTQRFQVSSGSTVAIELRAGAGAELVYFNSAQTPVVLQTHGTNIWYKVQIRGNVATDRMDIYVDGVRRANQVPFMRAVDSVNKLVFGTGSSSTLSHVHYVDDVSVN